MYLLNRGAGSAMSCPWDFVTPRRLVAASVTIVVSYLAFLVAWAWTSHGFTLADAGRPGADFQIFWIASYLLQHGSPLQVYDHLALAHADATVFGAFADAHPLPWLYPPASLLVIAPLAWLSYGVAYLVFTGVSVALYVLATLRVSNLSASMDTPRLGAVVIAAAPCVFITALVGQNSLLTAAIAGFALGLLDNKPVRAGLLIGVLAIKPQLAIVFPFVLVAARAYKTLAAAAAGALAVSAVGVAIAGPASVPRFLANADVLRSALVEHGQHFWLSSPTAFAAFRLAGMPVVAAYLAHAFVATVAICAACRVWRRSDDLRLRGAILAVAALLATPYAWHYELVWMGIALACLTALAFEDGWLRGEQAVLAAAWLLPIYEHLNRVMLAPQIGPLVLLAMMLVVLRRTRFAADGARP
ncbi:glycosyltransferase family 87 protein [Trinickia caryophylli]|uniref:DUF2029 domain-containing protein n=1 Tax=Trinickia caryophylli TaxID=28094 RepID=A0A1X7CWY0_TRICW|nr:glycosyltransferase family 87 protein [Trinickia caryophylli]PMS13446.1 DUF2029 domain-containing protein [Trinickia caryophylli]TRX13697.1 DUF2029 domain-containing protein [Trinickia caryophylli]WQE15282.1 glycosyltransferase family 87 protein [Trinickia caryophylli]SMF04547.1 Protein of unknown function [Trinickia caryophylli]GLU30966.1 hypothetical protein Busp01_08080 [Trinickia caryophylli]